MILLVRVGPDHRLYAHAGEGVGVLRIPDSVRSCPPPHGFHAAADRDELC